MVTIPEIISQLGYPWIKTLNWKIGTDVQRLYKADFGVLPEKALRPKTNPCATGSHCIAIYPPDWQVRIEEVCHRYYGEAGLTPTRSAS